LLLKICCMASVAEAQLAAAHGATHIGLVGPMPSGAGVIGLEAAADIAAGAPAAVQSVLLTSGETADAIAREVAVVRPNAVQIVRHVAPGALEALRALLPGIALIQVVHVEDGQSVARARDYARRADMLLLDSGRPSAAVAELGGTGRVHDWSLSRQIVQDSPVPVFLAGGLNPDNVGAAIRAVRPAGIDVCSGLRTISGALIVEKLAAFVAAIRVG